MSVSTLEIPGTILSWGGLSYRDLQRITPMDAVAMTINASESSSNTPSLMVFQGAPGAGKSTNFVTLLMSMFSRTCYMFMPRVAITRGVSRFITDAEQFQTPTKLELGKNVGYLTGQGDSIVPEHSNEPHIMYATHPLMDSILPEIFEDARDMFVLIDECHEVYDSSAVMNAFHDIKEYIRYKSSFSRVFIILVSATINFEFITSYFDIREESMNVLKMAGRKFDIERQILKVSSESWQRDLLERMRRNGDWRAILFTFVNKINNDSIEDYRVVNFNRTELNKNQYLLEDIAAMDQKVIIQSTQTGQAGVTFPNANSVYDDGTTPISLRIPIIGSPFLIKAYAPISTLIQREGRVGRTQSGISVRIIYNSMTSSLTSQSEIRYENDVASALVIAPSMYDVMRLMSQSETPVCQLPAAGIYEPLMTKIYLMGLHFMPHDVIRKFNTFAGMCEMQVESLLLMPILCSLGMSFYDAVITAAYHDFGTGEMSINKLVQLISEYESKKPEHRIRTFPTDVQYIIKIITNDEYYDAIIGDRPKEQQYINQIYAKCVRVLMNMDSVKPPIYAYRYNIESQGFDAIPEIISSFIREYAPSHIMKKCETCPGYDIMNIAHMNSPMKCDELKFYGSVVSARGKKYTFTPVIYVRAR